MQQLYSLIRCSRDRLHKTEPATPAPEPPPSKSPDNQTMDNTQTETPATPQIGNPATVPHSESPVIRNALTPIRVPVNAEASSFAYVLSWSMSDVETESVSG